MPFLKSRLHDRGFRRRLTKDGQLHADQRPLAPRPEPANKLSAAECAAVLEACNSTEFASLPICQIVPKLADQGRYGETVNRQWGWNDEEPCLQHAPPRPTGSHQPASGVKNGWLKTQVILRIAKYAFEMDSEAKWAARHQTQGPARTMPVPAVATIAKSWPTENIKASRDARTRAA